MPPHLLVTVAIFWSPSEDHDRRLPYFKRITEKHTANVPDDAAVRARLEREQRVLLVITPDDPIDQWTSWAR